MFNSKTGIFKAGTWQLDAGGKLRGQLHSMLVNPQSCKIHQLVELEKRIQD
jgi:hypothetical protein